jgi:hypothetical protein
VQMVNQFVVKDEHGLINMWHANSL